MDKLNQQETQAGNSSYAKAAVQFYASTLVLKIPHLRKARKR